MSGRRTGIRAIAVLGMLAAAACDFNVTITGPTSTNTNSNSNSNTVDFDLHDLVNFNPVFPVPGTPVPNPPNGTPEVPLTIPTNAQGIAQGVATANPQQIAQSCQATHGAAAWAFLDTVVKTLQAGDARWGYVGRSGSCAEIRQDVIGYRATSDNLGTWGVDIIVNHCGASPAFGWNVLGFDSNGRWCASR